ncbi:MAG: DUF4406 domain-containing protein [Bacteroidales bacterium]|nr:DUF4406 domain-containing protein [Bacteroidales bacterium]
MGKVTGLDRERCVAKFKDSQDMLEYAGYEVVNPTVLVPEATTWQEAMRICLRELLSVDAVAVQPDWYDSEGARVEYMVANALKLKMIHI